MTRQQTSDLIAFVSSLKNGIWLLGVSCWLFGITDRTIASFSDGYLSALDIVQLFTASFFFVSWLFLKPAKVDREVIHQE
ncbi:hypothetical protein ACKFKG_12515 [Phormidesmis sp. 146-35]